MACVLSFLWLMACVLSFFLAYGLCIVFSLAYSLCVYLGLFALPLVSLLYSVFVTTCSPGYLLYYSITSMARTRMARLPWMIRTIFSVPTKSFQ